MWVDINQAKMCLKHFKISDLGMKVDGHPSWITCVLTPLILASGLMVSALSLSKQVNGFLRALDI